MSTTRIVATTALASLLAGMSAGCATQASSEEAALERAYHKRVSVTGTRIKQRVETTARDPEVAFPIDSMNGVEAQESVRQMREAARQQP
jgi:hypothetical protein